MNFKNLKVAAISSLLVAICVAGRMFAHTPNFTPVLAVALFATFFFKSRLAILLPLSAMLASDLLIGFYDLKIMAVVYASMTVPALLGFAMRNRMTAPRVLGCTIGSSLIFFATTNLAVWGFSGMYDPSLSGLSACYAAALPFFRYSFAGDFAWSSILFGSYLLASKLVSVLPSSSANEPILGRMAA